MSTELYRASRRMRVIYYDGETAKDLDGFWRSISMNGSTRSPTRELNVDIVNTYDGRKPIIEFQHGKEIRVYDHNTELFRGVVVEFTADETGNVSVKAYDYNWYLEKNSDSIKFKNEKASDIIRKLCKKFEIPTGEIADTGHKLKKMIFQGKTLYEIIITALTETEKKTGETYRLFSKQGKLHLQKRTETFNWTVIEERRNLLSASYKQSIENVVTQVKLENDQEEEFAIATRERGVNDYGMLQHYENNNEAKTKGELEELARQILRNNQMIERDISVTALGIWGIEAGTGVAIREIMTGAYGGYYVLEDNHTYEANGMHTMSLKLQRTPDVDRIEYQPPPEPQPNDIAANAPAQQAQSGGQSSTPISTSSGFIRPAPGRITSGFRTAQRPSHNGIDIAQGGYVPIKAAASGKVVRSGWMNGYGETIIIRHNIQGMTWETLYAHMRSGSRRVRVGQSVRQGQEIGVMGNTGNSRGQHLHFEIHRGTWNGAKSNAVNPANYI